MRSGLYNIESCVASDGKPYLMEISEIQELAYGVPLIENEIRAALGLSLREMQPEKISGHWCEMVIHAKLEREGILQHIEIDGEILKKYVQLTDITAKPGDIVRPFTGANMSLGNIFLRFDTREELDEIISHSGEWLKIHLRE